jgi:hypothetical protein
MEKILGKRKMREPNKIYQAIMIKFLVEKDKKEDLNVTDFLL